MKAIDIAKYFVKLASDESDGITPLKLQKLLYYTQGFGFKLLDRSVIDDECEAWRYGPVFPSVYQHFRKYGQRPIDSSEKISLDDNSEVKKIVDIVWRDLKEYTAYELVERTHKELPWQQTDYLGNIIDKKIIKQFFINNF